jgi:hypothetical protein
MKFDETFKMILLIEFDPHFQTYLIYSILNKNLIDSHIIFFKQNESVVHLNKGIFKDISLH